MGVEVRNKTLGICGLGRVGSQVARRARSFDMRLVGYDPFVSPDYAKRMGIELLSVGCDEAEATSITEGMAVTVTGKLSVQESELRSFVVRLGPPEHEGLLLAVAASALGPSDGNIFSTPRHRSGSRGFRYGCHHGQRVYEFSSGG